MLRPVWLQLDLFPHRRSPVDFRSVKDAERDSRSSGQWLKAILSYLEFGTGDGWRRLSDPAQRNSPERLWYLNGIRAVRTILSGAPLPKPFLIPQPLPEDARVRQLSALPRPQLVQELMLANPSLTDKKILLHLSRPKLARLLLAAQDSACVEACA